MCFFLLFVDVVCTLEYLVSSAVGDVTEKGNLEMHSACVECVFCCGRVVGGVDDIHDVFVVYSFVVDCPVVVELYSHAVLVHELTE